MVVVGTLAIRVLLLSSRYAYAGSFPRLSELEELIYFVKNSPTMLDIEVLRETAMRTGPTQAQKEWNAAPIVESNPYSKPYPCFVTSSPRPCFYEHPGQH
jgi:hypothetical protein